KGKEVDWLVAGPQSTLTMTGGKTETVTITARPTATTPRGVHTLKLVVASKAAPDEEYADSPPVTCEVIAGGVVDGGTDTHPIPWKLILAIAGGVVLLGGGALAWWLLG